MLAYLGNAHSPQPSSNGGPAHAQRPAQERQTRHPAHVAEKSLWWAEGWPLAMSTFQSWDPGTMSTYLETGCVGVTRSRVGKGRLPRAIGAQYHNQRPCERASGPESEGETQCWERGRERQPPPLDRQDPASPGPWKEPGPAESLTSTPGPIPRSDLQNQETNLARCCYCQA